MPSAKSISTAALDAAIEDLALKLAERHAASARLLILGIANGGLELARRIERRLREALPQTTIEGGTLDISFHRDDIVRNPIPKALPPSFIPWNVNGATVVLIDDVLFTGRTVKAALNELFDHGRPATVELAVLVDRGGRTLPIAADYVGIALEVEETEKVVVGLDPEDPRRDTLTVRPAGQRSSRPLERLTLSEAPPARGATRSASRRSQGRQKSPAKPHA